jgi:hypothetical protein
MARYPVHLWNAGLTSITVERVFDTFSGNMAECGFMVLSPDEHRDCWMNTEVTAADFDAAHWEGRLFTVNATVVISSQDGSGGLAVYPVTTSAAFDLPYNAFIQYQAFASIVQLPNGGKLYIVLLLLLLRVVYVC